MRVWIDVTNSPHVVFFRPLVRLLAERGHDVTISARAFAQTLELLEDSGLDHGVGPTSRRCIKGREGPRNGVTAQRAPPVRPRATIRPRALHASHELPLAARSLGIPSAYAFDYEFAFAQHSFGCRAATRVVVPDAIPQSGSTGSAPGRARCVGTKGSRRSTTSTTSRPTRLFSKRSGSTVRASWPSYGRRPTSRCTTAARACSSGSC